MYVVVWGPSWGLRCGLNEGWSAVALHVGVGLLAWGVGGQALTVAASPSPYSFSTPTCLPTPPLLEPLPYVHPYPLLEPLLYAQSSSLTLIPAPMPIHILIIIM